VLTKREQRHSPHGKTAALLSRSFPALKRRTVPSEPVLKMGGAGDPPAPVGDPPTGIAASNVAKRRAHWLELSLRFRPASRRTEPEGRP